MMSLLLAVAAATPSPASEYQAINRVYSSLTAARASHEAAAMASHFDGNALLIDARPAAALKGNDLEARLTPMTARLVSEKVKVTTSYRVEQRAYYGDTIVDAGYMRMQFDAPEGAAKPRDMTNRFMVTMRKGTDGRWRIVGDASLPANPEVWDSLKPVAGLHFDS
jgi:ketosteroid isomerase-like protein